MSSNVKYSVLLEIFVQHDFFGSSLIPVNLALEDFEIQKKYDIQIKRIHNSWFLYASSSNILYLKEKFESLKFRVLVVDPILHYVSENLERSIELSIRDEKTELKISSKSKYLEYILFPKRNGHDSYLQIIDLNELIQFEEPEKISWHNNENALRVVSTEKVKLTKMNDSQLSIIEKSRYGNRILLNNITIPKPQSASIHDPHQCISAFYSI